MRNLIKIIGRNIIIITTLFTFLTKVGYMLKIETQVYLILSLIGFVYLYFMIDEKYIEVYKSRNKQKNKTIPHPIKAIENEIKSNRRYTPKEKKQSRQKIQAVINDTDKYLDEIFLPYIFLVFNSIKIWFVLISFIEWGLIKYFSYKKSEHKFAKIKTLVLVATFINVCVILLYAILKCFKIF